MRVVGIIRWMTGQNVCIIICISVLVMCLVFLQNSGSHFTISTYRNVSFVQKELHGSTDFLQTNQPEIHNDICLPKRNVVFLKVHKAGSTTVMNMFLRFATKRNLNIVLPRKTTGEGFNYLGYKTTLSRDNIVPLPGNETYNILCNHVVYNKSAFRSILPKNTVYIGIIREPIGQFLSTARYYKLSKYLKPYLDDIMQDDVVRALLQTPDYYLSKMDPRDALFLHNGMSTDFGLPVDMFKEYNYVERYFTELSEDFSLVMVLEHFQESLVLLRRTLCWNVQDIMYIPLNTAYSDTEDKHSVRMSRRSIELLRKFNSVDFKLYARFKAEFVEKVARLGQDFADELDSFKIAQMTVQDFCFVANSDTGSLENDINDQQDSLQIRASKWNPAFIISREDCNSMIEDELSIMRRLITKAWSKYRNF